MRVASIALLLGLALSARAQPAADPFAGTWEARVALGDAAYTLQLRCRSAAYCEMRRVDAKTPGNPDVLSFPQTVPVGNLEAVRAALRYAREHRSEKSPNPEFAALHRLLAPTLDAKADVGTCIALDHKAPEFFLVCTVRPASRPPALLLFGSLLGLCGQGFCKYLIYPLASTGAK